MIKNRRMMGERFGYWTGKEVEHTQFYGMDTIFISRYEVTERVLNKYPDVPHIFFAPINPNFSASAIRYSYRKFVGKVEELLEQGKYVTVEISANNLLKTQFTDVRKQFPYQFCLLLVVEVPELAAGGFAIKAAPLTVFEYVNPLEDCVVTAPYAVLEQGMTKWEEYEGDIDGEEL